MELRSLLGKAIKDFEIIVGELEAYFPTPQQSPYGDTFRYRHRTSERSDVLASFLKLVRVANLLNASLLLLDHGYVQEVYILGRAIDETTEDIHFWGMKIGETETSQNQASLLDDFYQDTLPNPQDPLAFSKRRPVQRAHIQEVLASVKDGREVETMKKVLKSIYRVFSGYAHGSYESIMELYGRRFHLRGMRDTPRVDEGLKNFGNYIYRSLLAAQLVAARAERSDIADRIAAIRVQFAEDLARLGVIIN